MQVADPIPPGIKDDANSAWKRLGGGTNEDRNFCKQALREIIDVEIERLEALRPAAWEAVEGPAKARAYELALVPIDADSLRRQRYEKMNESTMHRCLKDLEQRRKAREAVAAVEAKSKPKLLVAADAPNNNPWAGRTFDEIYHNVYGYDCLPKTLTEANPAEPKRTESVLPAAPSHPETIPTPAPTPVEGALSPLDGTDPPPISG